MREKKQNGEDKRKILLAEDDLFLSGMYQTKLELEGYQVTVVSDGEEVLDKMGRGSYDILLLDVMMPKLNGFEVLKEIRKDKKKSYADIPIIILTNLGQKSDVEQGLLLGANDYLIKANFTPAEVVQKIKGLIK